MAQGVPGPDLDRPRPGDAPRPSGAGDGADAADEPALDAVAPSEPQTRPTRRWYGIAGFGLLALALGLLVREPGLLLASVVGLGFAAYGRIAPRPTVDVAVERTIEATDSTPGATASASGGATDVAPGETATVEVTVTNEGDVPLLDARIVDGVPPGLEVVDGSPRRGPILRPGESTTVSYDVEAVRGAHQFDPLRIVARDPSGSTERVVAVEVETELTCIPELPADPPRFPLRRGATSYVGGSPSPEGGAGVEFHATREYRPGDAYRRIDWKRTARTGDLTTVEYRRERASTILLVIDARAEAHLAPDPTDPSAVERSVDAARYVAAALLNEGHAVGLAALSPRECWVAPGGGVEHRADLRTTLATHAAFAPDAPAERCNVVRAVREVLPRLPSDAQVVVCSPLCDDDAERAIRKFDAHGHPTTVVSPDPTTIETAGRSFAAVDRATRIARLRSRDVPVFDRPADESAERAMARAERRWSR